jgi:hypothetical protein
VRARGRSHDLGDDGIGHPVEHVVLAPHVGVERHRLDAELLREPAHAHGLDALPVREVDRRLQDTGPGEALAPVLGLRRFDRP